MRFHLVDLGLAAEAVASLAAGVAVSSLAPIPPAAASPSPLSSPQRLVPPVSRRAWLRRARLRCARLLVFLQELAAGYEPVPALRLR